MAKRTSRTKSKQLEAAIQRREQELMARKKALEEVARTKPRKKPPVPLGLYVHVYHIDSLEDRIKKSSLEKLKQDSDGHVTEFHVEIRGGESLMSLNVPRGTSRASVVGLLRKLADRFERAPEQLMNLRRDTAGTLNDDGIDYSEIWCDLYKEDGNDIDGRIEFI